MNALLLVLAGLPAAEPIVSATKTPTAITFQVAGQEAAVYHVGPDVAKPYVWPLYAPGQIPVTRAWPMKPGAPEETKDHPHQKSVWFCHGDIIPEGVPVIAKPKGVEGVDFWSEVPAHGKQVVVSVSDPVVVDNGQAVRFTNRNEWRTPEGAAVLNEERTITLRVLPGGGRLLIFDIDLHANQCPLVFGDTKEGSMGVRVNDEIRLAAGKGAMVGDDGRSGEKALWGMPAKWIDYSGPIGGQVAGVSVFDDPSNPHPAIWHARGYGLLAANPFGRERSGFPSQKGKGELVKLAKGEHLKLRYGVYAHAGDAAAGKVAEAYKVFVEGK